MSDLDRAFEDLAAARSYPETVHASWLAEYRRLVVVAAVIAAVAIVVSLVVVL